MGANPAFSSNKVVQINPGESYPEKFMGLPNPDWDLIDLGLTPEAFSVVSYLGRWKKVLRDKDNNLRWGASQQVCTIAKACFGSAYPNSPDGVLRRKANDAIGELVAHRIIEVQKRNPSDPFSSNNYFFLRKSEWEKPTHFQSSNVRKGRPAGITKPKVRSSEDRGISVRSSEDHDSICTSEDRSRTSQVQQRSSEDHKDIYEFKFKTLDSLNSDLITPDSCKSGNAEDLFFEEGELNQQFKPGGDRSTEKPEKHGLDQTKGSNETSSSAAEKLPKKEKSKRMQSRDERKAKYLAPGTGSYSAPAKPKWHPEEFDAWHPKYCALKQAVRGTPRRDRTEAAIAWATLPEMFVPKDFPSEDDLLQALRMGWAEFERRSWEAIAKGERCVPVPDAEVFLLGTTTRDPYWWIVAEGDLPLPQAEIFDRLWHGWSEGCQRMQQERQVFATPGSRKEAENAWRYLVQINGEEAISQRVDPSDLCQFYFERKLKAKDPAVAKLSTFLEPDKIEFLLECIRTGSVKEATSWQEWFNLARSLKVVEGSIAENGVNYVFVQAEDDPTSVRQVLRTDIMAEYPLERLREMQGSTVPAPPTKLPVQPTELKLQGEKKPLAVDTETNIEVEIQFYQGLYDQGDMESIENWWLYQIGAVAVKNDQLTYIT